jgi:hypothetical protein
MSRYKALGSPGKNDIPLLVSLVSESFGLSLSVVATGRCHRLDAISGTRNASRKRGTWLLTRVSIQLKVTTGRPLVWNTSVGSAGHS